MQRDNERDFVGYGSRPPKVAWQNDARLCVSLGVNLEEGSEYSLQDNDRREMQGEVPSSVPAKARDLYNESFYEYGSRVGVWRLLDILAEYETPSTFYVCGLAAERNPEAAKAIVAQGHEPCGHGYQWRESHLMSREEEREDIRRCVQAITATTGVRPVGWLSRYSSSLNTRSLVQEEGGFLYDMGAFNDDLPYYVLVNERPWLVIPYSLELNDARCWRGSMLDGPGLEDVFISAFDRLYKEGAKNPKMVSIGLHCRIGGTAARARAFERFLMHAKKHSGVWFARRVDIARWWMDRYPPER